MRNVKRFMWAIPILTVCATILSALQFGLTASASDPSPVNPPGPIPLILVDASGRNYDVFTPEEGGSIIGDNYSFVAQPGDVPNALIVGVHMYEVGEASNIGKPHHRYTLGGNLYSIGAVDEYGRPPSPWFKFRNPPVACLPVPPRFFTNIDDLAVIATDSMGSTETILNSEVRINDSGLMVCGYLGTAPATVAVGMEGSPGSIPSTPMSETQVNRLPVTGGVAPSQSATIIVLLLGVVFVGVALAFIFHRGRRRNQV